MADDYTAEKIVALEGGIRGPKGIFITVLGLTKSKKEILRTFWLNRELRLFSKMYDIEKLQTRQLRKAIHEWNKLLSNNPRLLLTEKQHDVILGTLLGDANVRNRGKSCQYRMAHSDKQSLYLYWLHDLFAEFTNKTIHIREKQNRLPMLWFETLTHPIFNYYFSLFYKNNKKEVTKEILNMLTPQSLAVWICDDGSYSVSGKHIILCTNSFSLEEHKLMQNYFKEKWDINCSIRFRDNKYYYLSFYKKDTKKLIAIIKEFIPIGMKYKVGE